MRGTGNGFIEIIYVRLVMFTMMDLHGKCVDVWFECVVRVRKGSKCKWHINIF